MSEETPEDVEAAGVRQHVSTSSGWIGKASAIVGALDAATLGILMAWFVTTEQLGIATLASLFFPILDTASDLGLSSALIQRKDRADESTLSTVFWLNLLVTSSIFGAICLSAGWYAGLKHEPVVKWLLIAYGSQLVWKNIYLIPQSLMRREFRFKELSIIRVIANVIEFLAKVGFAWAGEPIWCFVLGPILRNLATGIGVLICHPWFPKLVVRARETIHEVRFGLKTSLSQLLYQWYTNADYLVVGMLFQPDQLGLYRFAFELVLYPVRFMSEITMAVGLPAFARLRGSIGALRDAFIALTRQNLYMIVPFVALIVVEGADILSLFDKGKGQGGPAMVRIFCIAAVLRGLSPVIMPLLDGIGRPGLTALYTIVASIVLPVAYVAFGELLGARLGAVSVSLAWAVAYPVAFAVLAVYGLRAVEMRFAQYVAVTWGLFGCAAVACLPGFALRYGLVFAHVPALARVVLVGGAMVIVILWMFVKTQGLVLPRRRA